MPSRDPRATVLALSCAGPRVSGPVRVGRDVFVIALETSRTANHLERQTGTAVVDVLLTALSAVRMTSVTASG